MAEDVKRKRPYHSPQRQRQAAVTRRAVLEAAQRLFERDGYRVTTMEAIAAAAGVALKTVYLAFETKSKLLRAVWDLALKGDADDAPVAERPWYLEVLEEQDPEQQLRLNARNSRVVKVRIAPMLAVIRDAASMDPDAGALWQLIQSDFYENQRVVVESLQRKGALAPTLDATLATDILWTLNHPDVWLLLVGRRGWTPDQFEHWFAENTCAQLLAPAARSGRGSRRKGVEPASGRS
jgi:AcrR family transcriptional regulator